MYKSISFSSVIMSFLLVACTSQPVTFETMQPSAEKGSIVYVYRPLSMANSMVSPKLLLNGKAIFELKNGSYQYNYVPAGKQVFSLDLSDRYTGNKRIALEVKPNNIYFIRATSALGFEMNKPYTRSFNLGSVDSSAALHELSKIAAGGKSLSSFKKGVVRESSTSEKIEDTQFSIENTRNPFYK